MSNRKVIVATSCPTCCRSATAPFRIFDARGQVMAGCVDHFHTGHLVTPSASASWHARPVSKSIRAKSKAMRDGFVTQVAA